VFGDSLVYVQSDVGFSLDDMILISDEVNTFEYVQITNIGSRRLQNADWEERELSGLHFEVYPALEYSYPTGSLVANQGPASLFAGGDPVTYFGGKKFKFWMPLHTELELLRTPEMTLYGTVFPGPKSDQQWFDYFKVAFPDGTPVAQVSVKRDRYSNRTLSSRCASRRFETLDIFLGSSTSPLKEMKKMEISAGKSVRFEINCRNQASRTEYLYFETPSIVFVITSSHAGVEFPDDAQLAFKYTHLDFIVLETVRPQSFSGILPEIWDIRPRSKAVEAMLHPPDNSEASVPKVCQEESTSLSNCTS